MIATQHIDKMSKTNPVLLVNILVSVPLAGQKRVLLRNYLAVEERRQCRKLLRETLDFQIATQVTVFLVHVLQTRRTHVQ